MIKTRILTIRRDVKGRKEAWENTAPVVTLVERGGHDGLDRRASRRVSQGIRDAAGVVAGALVAKPNRSLMSSRGRLDEGRMMLRCVCGWRRGAQRPKASTVS